MQLLDVAQIGWLNYMILYLVYIYCQEILLIEITLSNDTLTILYVEYEQSGVKSKVPGSDKSIATEET